MQKRLLSLALSLAMLLTMTPLVVGAAEEAATVTIGSTELESGKYYVPATVPAENGAPAYIRMVDTRNEEPTTGSYLEYKDGILTVHGSVELNCMASAVTVNGGALMITGNDESSLSVASSGMSPLYSTETSTITLAGDFDFTLNSSSAPAVALNDGTLTTAEGYTGDIVFTNSSTSPVVSGASAVNLNTAGDISFSKSSNSSPAIVSSALTLYADHITIEGGAISSQRIGMVAQKDVLMTANTPASMLNNMTDIAAGGNVTLKNEGGMLVSSGLRLIRLNGVGKGGTVLLQGGTASIPLTSASSENFTISDYAEVTIRNNDVNGNLLPNPASVPTVTNYDKLVLISNNKRITTENGKTTTEYCSLPTDFTTLPTEPAVYPAGEGTAEFTPATEEGGIPTLTLKNATAGNIKLGGNSLNIVVEGENTIGQVEASNAKVNVTGDGSLKAATLRAGTNGELIVDIKGTLELIYSSGAMTNSKAEISAKSIKLKGPYGFQQTATVPVSLTATDGDIEFDGINNSSFTFSNIQLTLKAPNGNVISKSAPFSCPVDILAKGNVSITGQSYGAGVMQNTTEISSETGNIDVSCEGEYAAAININSSGKDVVLSAPNGKVTVSSSQGAILNTFNNSPSGSVAIHAKEVEISSSPSKTYSTIKTAQLTIDDGYGANCDKVTITGKGKSDYSNNNSYSVLYASGEIKSNDLLIKASAQNGHATGEGTIALKGIGKVIGNVGDGTTHDSTVEILGASAGELTNVAFHNATEKTLFTSGEGYVVYDPKEKTLLLQDAVINDSISLDEGSEIKVTTNGSLTIESGGLQLENAASVTVESNAPISLAEGTSLTLPTTATANDLNSLNLSGTGSVGYGEQSGAVTALVYELDGGVNADTNPTTYIGFTADKAPKDYYPIALAAPTKEGYHFQGWYTDKNYTMKVEAIKDNTVTTLYAKWEKQTTNNGGSSSSSSSSSSNAVTAPGKTENGSISVGAKNAKKGDTVTITVTPSSGYQVGQVTVKDAKGNTVAVKDLGGGKYSFVMPATKVSVDASFVKEVTPAADFVDVAANAWYKSAVDYVVQKGLMTGTGEKTFSPEAPMTRAMLMTVLARYAGEDTSGGATWYEKGMTWAVTNGVSDGSDPTGNITREQLVTMLYRYVGSPKTSGSLAAFADANTVSAYAVQAMQWAVEQGILTGITPTTITPKGSATRAQVATILMRFCQGQGA